MSCPISQTTNNCITSSAVIDCIKVFYSGETYIINLTLFDKNGNSINLDDVNSIQILLYDIREYIIARFIHPITTDSNIYTDTFNLYTGVDDYTDEFTVNDIWFDNQEIIINQQTINTTTDIIDDYIINKGNISFTISSQISSYLMIGNIFVDIRLLYNDGRVEIIKCLPIGINKKNKF